jgi:hypothetical protein
MSSDEEEDGFEVRSKFKTMLSSLHTHNAIPMTSKYALSSKRHNYAHAFYDCIKDHFLEVVQDMRL